LLHNDIELYSSDLLIRKLFIPLQTQDENTHRN